MGVFVSKSHLVKVVGEQVIINRAIYGVMWWLINFYNLLPLGCGGRQWQWIQKQGRWMHGQENCKQLLIRHKEGF